MSEIKERILGAVTVMTDDDAQFLWENIINYFSNKAWNNIKTETPDKIDLEMLKDISLDSDCSSFISSEELKASLGL